MTKQLLAVDPYSIDAFGVKTLTFPRGKCIYLKMGGFSFYSHLSLVAYKVLAFEEPSFPIEKSTVFMK